MTPARETGPADQHVPTPLVTELSTRRLGPVRRYFAQRPRAMDAVIMGVFALPGVLGILVLVAGPFEAVDTPGIPEGPARIRSLVIGLVIVALGTVALNWRRSRPVLVAAALTLLDVTAMVTIGATFELGVAFAVYAVAACRRPRTTWVTFGATTAASGLTALAVGVDTVVIFTSLLAVAIGTSVRNRRLHVADLVERTNSLARERDRQVLLARAGERSRIAREMHDVVAHSLAVMIALADGAAATLDRAADRSRAALDELSETGRAALADMRRVLGVLHEPDAPFEPQPGSTDVAALVDRCRAAGLPVRAVGLSTPLPDDAGLQLAVYRIVSEALTNALQHAPGTAGVELELRRTTESVEIEVRDLGPAVPEDPAPTGGQGIIGMLERAAVYGGTVESGPHGSGWRVHAVLPLDGDGRGVVSGPPGAAGPDLTPTPPVAPVTEISARRLGPVRRYFARHPVAMDLVVMAVFGLPTILSAVFSPPPDVPGGVDPTTARVVAGFVLPALGVVALFWRRRAPVVVIAAMTAMGLVALATVGSTGGFEVGIALALYAVAAGHRPRTTWLAFSASMVAFNLAAWLWESTVAQVTAGTGADDDLVLSETGARVTTASFTVVLALLAVAIGTSVRNRRLHVAEIVGRADALARDRDQQARLARAAERSRIAREMHDVVAHSISVMIALADGASVAVARAPDRARTAIDELSSTGRSALADMRRVLGVLHEGDGADAPQPGEVDLAAVVERFRTAGLPIRATGLGTTLPADPGLRLAIHRIVSEALTNALRHAPGTTQVDLTLRSDDGTVEIVVTDQGPTLPVTDAGGAGQGVIGMVERAAVHGGTVDAGPWERGWRVRAVLPWPETEETR